MSAARAVSNMLIFRPEHSVVHTKSSSTLASLAIGTEIGLVARIDTGSSKIFTKYSLSTTLQSSRKERSKTRQDGWHAAYMLQVARPATIVRHSRVAFCNLASPATQMYNTKVTARRQGVACCIHKEFVLGNCVPSDSCHVMSRCIGLPGQAGYVPMNLLYSV
jgi:hypothetical protein